MKIRIFSEKKNVQNFTFQPGFAALVENEKILAATSGWVYNDYIKVYRPTADGSWIGNWEEQDSFPVDEVLSAIEDWKERQELSRALAYAEGKKLYVSDRDIVFTEVVPGEKFRNGGEYGFYMRYSPIPEHPGIYRVFSETTCDSDACGTGFEVIRALTVREYRRLCKASDKIEAAGSLY